MVKKKESVTRYDFETPKGLLVVTCGPSGMRTRLIKNPNYILSPKSRRAVRPSFISRRRLGPVLPLTDRSPLPSFVKPLPDEALLSWLLRLATHLDLSMDELAQDGFGVVDYSAHSNWWRRPRLEVLERIHVRTGLEMLSLRRMTLVGWSVYRKDEATERFGQHVYESLAPHRRLQRWAVCRQCLATDPVPYLRQSWMIGWLGVCPIHGTILIDRCAACDAKPFAAPFGSKVPFTPLTCRRCGATLEGFDRLARPSVARFQAALLQGKRTGHLELAGIGRLSWREMVALADVVLGVLWTVLTGDELKAVWATYWEEFEWEPPESRIRVERYGSLETLVWFLEGWPRSPGSAVATELFARWLTGRRNRISRHVPGTRADPWESGRAEFNPRIRERIRTLYEGTISSSVP